MSYEGTEEFICDLGHYWTADALTFMYADGEEKERTMTCSHCKGRAKWWSSIDETNGFYENEPRTFEAKKTLVGFYDVPLVDHRGNHYVGLLNKWEPDPTARWELLPTDEEEANDA